MPPFSEETFLFMSDLWANNSKIWFDLNRKRYEDHVQKPLKELAAELAAPVSSFLANAGGRVKVSRINNDIRFSPGKPLYKEHMWISFGGVVGTGCADLFFGISGSGWSAGAGISASKREPLDGWRENLIAQSGRWAKFADAMQDTYGFRTYAENPYGRPLYPNVPDPVRFLVQAREVWLVTNPRRTFGEAPAKEAFIALAAMLPAYIFMTAPRALLNERLEELTDAFEPPDEVVRRVWEAVGA